MTICYFFCPLPTLFSEKFVQKCLWIILDIECLIVAIILGGKGKTYGSLFHIMACMTFGWFQSLYIWMHQTLAYIYFCSEHFLKNFCDLLGTFYHILAILRYPHKFRIYYLIDSCRKERMILLPKLEKSFIWQLCFFIFQFILFW